MSDLFLESLKIEGFRAFDHLEIEKLGRVNLIVGKNSVGKTCLLEALLLYANEGSISTIMSTLSSRNEYDPTYRYAPPYSRRGRGGVNIEEQTEAFSFLFHGYRRATEVRSSIRVGPGQFGRDELVVNYKWLNPKNQPNLFEEDPYVKDVLPAISVRFGEKEEAVYKLDRDLRDYMRAWRSGRSLGGVEAIYLSSDGLERREVSSLWDGVAITDQEASVIEGLQVILPRVQRLSVVGNPDRSRAPIVRLRDLPDPIPLRNLGEGMVRMFDITLSLVSAEGGILLIDEIESGLHYGVQAKMWRLVFEIASKLNVQVFATTHSMDCIRAFQRAAEEHEEEGVLISLRRKRGAGDGVVAVLADEDALRTVVASDIEVR